MKNLSTNKKALFDYEVLKEYEAGIVLNGWEVKSIRSGNASLKESYITVSKGEVWLVGMHISPWPGMSKNELGNEVRDRKLLLNSTEITKITQAKSIQGNTLIPINLHLSRNKIKVKLAVARGKKKYDKRQKLKEKDIKKQIDRDLKDY